MLCLEWTSALVATFVHAQPGGKKQRLIEDCERALRKLAIFMDETITVRGIGFVSGAVQLILVSFESSTCTVFLVHPLVFIARELDGLGYSPLEVGTDVLADAYRQCFATPADPDASVVCFAWAAEQHC